MDEREDAVVDGHISFSLVFKGTPAEVKKWLNEQPVRHGDWIVVTGGPNVDYYQVADYLRRG